MGFQEGLSKEDMFKSMSNSPSLINCTKQISHKSAYVNSNHPQVNHIKVTYPLLNTFGIQTFNLQNNDINAIHLKI